MYKCQVCNKLVTKDEGVTTLNGYWVCDNNSCRILREDNESIERDKKMKVSYYKVGCEPETIEIENSLEALQELVGGYIEVVTIDRTKSILLICNEEGRIDQLPKNRLVKKENGKIVDIIYGDFFICQSKGEDFCSIEDQNIDAVKKHFC